MKNEDQPYIGPSTTLPETTFKAFVLGALLSVVLSAANAYLGLFAGMTVSASIPAAVLSMAILRLFKKHNILENNIVQTAASAGESLAAGVIFTFPALVLMGYWTHFILGAWVGTVAVAGWTRLAALLALALTLYQTLDFLAGGEELVSDEFAYFRDVAEYALGCCFVLLGSRLEAWKKHCKST